MIRRSRTSENLPRSNHLHRQGGTRDGIARTWVLIAAVVVICGTLPFFSAAAWGNTPSRSKPVENGATSGVVYFRPVLCFAAPKANSSGPDLGNFPRGEERIPACQPNYRLTTSKLDVTPSHSSPQGYTSKNSEADPQYATDNSTNVGEAGYGSKSVLLPGIGATCGAVKLRCVLGPAEMSSHAIKSVTVEKDHSGGWIVSYTMAGASNSALWDKVLQSNFHQFLGVEVDGLVYSAILIEPQVSSFYSLNGRGQISGFFTHAQASHLAQEIMGHETQAR